MSEFMEAGLKIKTMNDYKREISKFKTYLDNLGDTKRVQNYLLDPIQGTTDGSRDQSLELIRYAMHLSKDETLTPSAFDTQFHAIRRFMIHNARDVRAFDMESVKEARRIARSKVSESRKIVVEAMGSAEKATYESRYGVKVPFTEEMMIAHRRDYFASRTATIEDKMAYVATALGYHLGNRPSEESSNGPLATDAKGKKDEDHRYMNEDVQYQLLDESFITGADINAANKAEIKYISVMVNSHKGETIKMKTSPRATQRQPNAVRRDNGDMERQLFEDLIEWPVIANLRSDDVFFSRNAGGKNLKLTTKSMVSRMKMTAEKQGIDQTLISAKSLRRALGTDMTRSNIDQQAINALGRWSPRSTVCGNVYAMAAPNDITGTMSEGVIRTSNNDVHRYGRTRDQLAKDTAKRR